MDTDRIEKRVLLKASRSRVWRALTDSKEFGSWFGMRLEGPFVAGTQLKGAIAPTTVDPEVAKLQVPHVGKPVMLHIDKIEPERLFSFRWHPFAVDPQMDYSREPMTLITFTLEETPEGVRLTLTESGFDGLEPQRKREAMKANDGGWSKQMELIAGYLKQHARE